MKLVWKDQRSISGSISAIRSFSTIRASTAGTALFISIDDRKLRTPTTRSRADACRSRWIANGAAIPQDYLLTLVQAGKAQVAIQLNAGTTVDNLGNPDTGFKAEVASI